MPVIRNPDYSVAVYSNDLEVISVYAEKSPLKKILMWGMITDSSRDIGVCFEFENGQFCDDIRYPNEEYALGEIALFPNLQNCPIYMNGIEVVKGT